MNCLNQKHVSLVEKLIVEIQIASDGGEYIIK